MKRLTMLRQRAKSAFYEGDTLKIDNGTYMYVKNGQYLDV